VSPNSLRDLADSEELADSIPNGSSRLPPEGGNGIARFEQVPRRIQPEELDQGSSVSARIPSAGPYPRKANAIGSYVDGLDRPPRRNRRDRVVDMLAAHHEARSVEDARVQVDLAGQAAQGVAVRLDFVAVERAVDDRDIDAHLASAKAELLEERGVRVSGVTLPKMRQQGSTNLGVPWWDLRGGVPRRMLGHRASSSGSMGNTFSESARGSLPTAPCAQSRCTPARDENEKRSRRDGEHDHHAVVR
jgi:hypothetical protein